MLGRHLRKSAKLHGDKVALISGREHFTFEEIGSKIDAIVTSYKHLSRTRVCLSAQTPANFVSAAAALDLLGCHTFLAGVRGRDELSELESIFSWSEIITDEAIEEILSSKSGKNVVADETGKVTIFTSGTTGIPKAATHTWVTLASPVRRDGQYYNTRWLCAYPLNLYAGTQVLLQALLNNATLVTPGSLQPGDVAATLIQAGVTHASGTPTFWRQLLLFASWDELRSSHLKQITLGGEAVPQELLDQLRSVFPEARLVHIYATTELGRLFTVTDGFEGFPSRYIEEAPDDGVELRIYDGKLFARSHNTMLGYEGKQIPRDEQGWIATGDVVETRGERVIFAGRESDIINVGGAKVHPAQVEKALREIQGVADIRVYGKSSSIVGAVVAADVQLVSGAEPNQVRSEVQRISRERLQPFQVPKFVRIVPKTETTEAVKTIRKIVQ